MPAIIFLYSQVSTAISLISLPVLAQEGAKDATAQTKSANDALYGQLPFTDKTDFMNAHKGFIAPLPSELIKGKHLLKCCGM